MEAHTIKAVGRRDDMLVGDEGSGANKGSAFSRPLGHDRNGFGMIIP
jgi:hypothetical protein